MRIKVANFVLVSCSFKAYCYGNPNGAKFKKQNWLHVQQICYQGQGRFQSSSTKSIHVQPIFSLRSRHLESSSTKYRRHFQDITFQGQELNESSSRDYLRCFQENFISISRLVSYQPQIFPITFQQLDQQATQANFRHKIGCLCLLFSQGSLCLKRLIKT